MTFCTAINCMDGRVQTPVNAYLRKRFKAEFVDTITEAGPNRILAEGKDLTTIHSILNRLKISVERHHSTGIAIVGHHDCAGNPAPEAIQIDHLHKSMQWLHRNFPQVDIAGIWVNAQWQSVEIPLALPPEDKS